MQTILIVLILLVVVYVSAFVPVVGNSYFIRNASNNKTLDGNYYVANQFNYPYYRFFLWELTWGGVNQKWTVVATTEPTKQSLHSDYTGLFLNGMLTNLQYNDSYPTAFLSYYQKGLPINLRWELIDVGNGYYQLINSASRKALDASTDHPQFDPHYPAPWLATPDSNRTYQQWEFVDWVSCPEGSTGCGQACFSPSIYTCIGGTDNHDYLCPVGNQLCGTSCYDIGVSKCVRGILHPK